MQFQRDLRVRAVEFLDDFRQRVARLRVGGGNHQAAAVHAGILAGVAPQVFRFLQDAADDLHRAVAGACQGGEALAGTDEQFDTQFILEVLDLLAHAGLRRVQHGGHLGQVQVVAHGFAHEAQLLEIHGSLRSTVRLPS
ncbi:hypothetical protein GCM10007386_47730 [Pseudoduganella dura]|nr:hypothetical protein GCM10007386_47730 [Pseudoduganella dura]